MFKMFYLRENLLFLITVGIIFSAQIGFCQNKIASDSTTDGSVIKRISKPVFYPDGRPYATYSVNPLDGGIVFKHGNGLDSCDIYGARDIWVWEYQHTYYMHYDGAGPKGWVACLAESKDLMKWKAKCSVLPLGKEGTDGCASASYGTTFYDKGKWHMFYLGTPHTSPAPDLVPAFPYLTMKAQSNAPTGPWEKQYDGNKSPVLPQGNKSLMNRDIGMAWLKLPILLPETQNSDQRK